MNQSKLLTYWKEESEISIWLNYQTLDYLEKWNNYLTLPPILISALSSIVLIITSNNETAHIYGNMIIGILLIISTFIQSYKKTIDLENRIVNHKNIIQLNQELILDIQEFLNQLSRDIDSSNDASLIINEIKNKKKYILKKKTHIPKYIYTKLENKIESGEPININQTSLLYKYLQEKIIDISPEMLFSIHSDNETIQESEQSNYESHEDKNESHEDKHESQQTNINNKYINQINYKLSQL